MVLGISDLRWGSNGEIGPYLFSWFHFLWLAICIVLCVVFARLAKKHNAKQVDKTIFIIDMILFGMEIIKQYMYCVEYYGYLRIDTLPFAFCSVPLFIALIGSLVKNEKVKNSCYLFLSFYGAVGGIGVMLYPASLYTSFIYTSFHTMIWHTLLVVMAVYLIVAKGYGKSFKKEVLPPFITFFICSLIAIGLNESIYYLYLKDESTPTIEAVYCPGSYEYYREGFVKEDSYEYIEYTGYEIKLNSDYKECPQMVIVNPEGENYDKFYITFEFFDETYYLEINNNQIEANITPTSTWEMIALDYQYVFAYNDAGTNKVICMDESNNLVVSTVDGYTSNLKLSKFIKIEVGRDDDSAEFFFISSHYESFIPVLNIVQKYAPYPIFLLCYYIGFFGIAALVWLFAHIFNKKRYQSIE